MQAWIHAAIKKIEADFQRSSDTHLLKLRLPVLHQAGIDIYLKDESTHPSGSLKHRLARSLFLYALSNGKLSADMPVIEASSGSTAVSEAYFAQMLGLKFIAVMPKQTATTKIAQIRLYGGECHFVDRADQMHSTAKALAEQCGGYFMDQFLYAERATDWRGNNNIAESIFQQMTLEPYPVPTVIVMSAGTGGTSATLGRYILYKGYATELVVADPDASVYFDYYQSRDASLTAASGSQIEGIGRPKVEASFQPDVISRMTKVPDEASLATMLWLNETLGLCAGPSTGTNLWAALKEAEQMLAAQQQGSIVTVLCDNGSRYQDSYYDPIWRDAHFGDLSLYQQQLRRFSAE